MYRFLLFLSLIFFCSCSNQGSNEFRYKKYSTVTFEIRVELQNLNALDEIYDSLENQKSGLLLSSTFLSSSAYSTKYNFDFAGDCLTAMEEAEKFVGKATLGKSYRTSVFEQFHRTSKCETFP